MINIFVAAAFVLHVLMCYIKLHFFFFTFTHYRDSRLSIHIFTPISNDSSGKQHKRNDVRLCLVFTAVYGRECIETNATFKRNENKYNEDERKKKRRANFQWWWLQHSQQLRMHENAAAITNITILTMSTTHSQLFCRRS